MGRLSLYENTLVSEIERFSYFPYVLSQDSFVINSLENGNLNGLNERLAAFVDKSGLAYIYLMDKNGVTVSASNYKSKNSFIGRSYKFRPYFKQAIQGSRGEFYGIGVTTFLPGYFISAPVRKVNGEIIGVVAIKIDLRKLEEIWASAGENVLLTNRDGIVLLSSNKAWRYRSLFPISDKRRIEIREERQFANQPLKSLNWRVWNETEAVVEGQHFLIEQKELQQREWTLHYFASDRPVQEKTWLALISIIVVLVIIFSYLQLRRSLKIGQALRDSQADSAELREANLRLAHEVEERKATEERLKKTRSELSRASRLAALGQLSVSVTHELGQPIAAMRNYLTAAEFAPVPPEASFLEKMTNLALRMENITKQLKFFAQPGELRFEQVNMHDVIAGAQELVMPNLGASCAQLKKELVERAVYVRGNQLRLEQVLTNLMRNALDAMEGTDQSFLIIRMTCTTDKAIIEVLDTGSGLEGATLEKLQEPFVTSKASGKGMGLGLSISTEIVKEHNGALKARNRDKGGAAFSIELPLSDEE
ncbi:sensor histidine kinase [Candidatus Terasakiella magnetica]|nr:ATP-binding protein [Candidatus Terasakiella magnetica]